MISQTFSIGELSREFSITPRTLRFYEEKNLLNPKRDGQNRIYTKADRGRLKLILRGKRLGFSLQESAELIAMYNKQTSNHRQLEVTIKKIVNRRKALQNQMQELKQTIADMQEYEHYYQAVLDGKLTKIPDTVGD